MIVARAPGKLFLAGEYAVLEPGRPAVVMAVDRYVTVRLSRAGETWTTLRSDALGGITLRLHREGGRLVAEECPERVLAEFRFVSAALSVVETLITERGLRPSPLRLTITSDLTDRDGHKLGLGSSAAVTVATVSALIRFYRLEPSASLRYRLALLATATVSPQTSGADLAAGVWGGWLAYRAPDRYRVHELVREHGVDSALHREWPGFEVQPLRPPTKLRLLVGWTGQPASTTGLIAAQQRTSTQAHSRFLTESTRCVEALVCALEADDPSWVQDEIRCARGLLAELDAATGAGIMTPGLVALCTSAEAVGAASKPSGAGGGDCGIAILPIEAAHRVAEVYERWAEAGIRPLPLRVVQPVEETE
ncbi:phosphomevalonate kinase [Nocardia sp. CDC159]|uniref:phosphomevalonate kinase n=1 Tax=Nocardia pulmonis TaxID=2951408 RepID=A0A9X2J0D7_9NOCA|nr:MULTISPECIES: phosphomevalonate kinase [Nocardia]MCM6778448.1 phosphomevalonate kinase [Nocardia pulmonis]MCM6791337.1 phosphomevalonate kinase [Nocardia sp. CDC159]